MKLYTKQEINDIITRIDKISELKSKKDMWDDCFVYMDEVFWMMVRLINNLADPTYETIKRDQLLNTLSVYKNMLLVLLGE